MAGRKGEERLDSKIIIRNYPPETSDKDMRIMFEKYGKIDDLFSPKDKETRKPRGFTFCQYKRKEDAEEAVKGMDKREIDSYKLSVEFCRIPRPTRDRSRERYSRDRDRRRSRSRSPRDRRRSPLIRARGRDHEYYRDGRGSDGYHSGRLGSLRGGDYDSYGLPHQPAPGSEHPYGPPPQRGVPGGGGYGHTEPGTRDSYNGPPPSRGGSGNYFAGSGGPPSHSAPGSDSYAPSSGRGYYDDSTHRTYPDGPPQSASHLPPDSMYSSSSRDGPPNLAGHGNSDLDGRRGASGGYDNFHSSSGPPSSHDTYDPPPSGVGRESYRGGGGGGRDSYSAGSSSNVNFGTRSSSINSSRANNATSLPSGAAAYGGNAVPPASSGRYGGGGGNSQVGVGYGSTKNNYAQGGPDSDSYASGRGGYGSRASTRPSRFSDANPSSAPSHSASGYATGRYGGSGRASRGSASSSYNATPSGGGSGTLFGGGASSNLGNDYRNIPPPGAVGGVGRGGARQEEQRGGGGGSSSASGSYRGGGLGGGSSYGSGGFSSGHLPPAGGVGGGYGSSTRGDYSYGQSYGGAVSEGRY